MTIKKAISLKTDVYKAGEEKARRLFGGNFSAYICYLISKDREESEKRKEKKKEKDKKVIAAIDEIMEI